MAYIGNSSGTEKCLFELAEFGFHDDPRPFSPLATTNGVLLSNAGMSVLPMKNFNFGLIAPSAGYVYSGETVATGFYVNGSQIKLCKPGCRPGTRQQLYRFSNTSYSDVTKYVNTFSDGEIWVSDTSGERNGTKISLKLSDWKTGDGLPRGMLYSVCCLVGAGGGGGAAGLLASYDNNGGSGGVSFFISRWLRLSVVDSVTLLLGGVGKGAPKGIGNDGARGGDSYLAGRVQITSGGGAKGGGKANGGSNNAPSQTATVSYPWGTTYQSAITSSNGSDTSSSSTVSATFPSPEGGTVTSTSRYGGSAGSGSGYGAAGDGNPSSLTIWY